jgi:hypothetical protein
LGLLPKEVIEEIVDMHERRRQIVENPPALSSEEQAFFKFFEVEMRKTDTRL